MDEVEILGRISTWVNLALKETSMMKAGQNNVFDLATSREWLAEVSKSRNIHTPSS